MRNILLVARHELWRHVGKPSFLLATLAVPLIAIIVTLVLGDFSLGGVTEPVEEPAGVEEEVDLPETGVIGYVDFSGIVKGVPALEGRVLAFEGERDAAMALRAGEVDAYYIIPADYLGTGDVERVARRFEPDADDTALVEFLLVSSLLEGTDPAVGFLARDPVPRSMLQHENVGQRAADRLGENAEGLAFGIAYALAMLLYTTTFMAASYLLQSLATEKENRMMELLLTSIRPFELLAGKVLGLGLLGLGQTILWAAVAYGVAQMGLIDVSLEALGIDWRLGVMIVLYYVLGYGIYASLMAAIGALVPSVKESGPATMLVVLPAILPLMFLNTIVTEPNGSLAVLFSLVPFTAPITMMVRLVQGSTPAWQIVLSMLIMAASVPLLLNLVARLFRAQTLLSSETISVKRAWAVLTR